MRISPHLVHLQGHIPIYIHRLLTQHYLHDTIWLVNGHQHKGGDVRLRLQRTIRMTMTETPPQECFSIQITQLIKTLKKGRMVQKKLVISSCFKNKFPDLYILRLL